MRRLDAPEIIPHNQELMANPLGANGRTPRPLRDALRVAAMRDDGRFLRLITEALLTKAATGDTAAMALAFERLDGKVAQPVGGSDELGPTRLHITWKSNDPNDLVPVNAAPALIEQHELQTVAANQAAQAIDKVG